MAFELHYLKDLISIFFVKNVKNVNPIYTIYLTYCNNLQVYEK